MPLYDWCQIVHVRFFHSKKNFEAGKKATDNNRHSPLLHFHKKGLQKITLPPHYHLRKEQ